MIDNLTNNPRKREPLHTQWWVPDSKEMLEKKDWEFLVPLRKLNAVQKAMFRKMVKENFGHLLEQPTTFKGIILSVPLLCKDLPYDHKPTVALLTEPIFSGFSGQCWSVPFVRWLDFSESSALLEKFLSTLEKNVAYENPFYQETKE